MNNLSSSAAGNRGPAPATMSVADVWYALFRHKWKVLILSTLGVVAAGALYVKNKPPYVSEAKLLVRYVVESRSVEALGPDGQVRAAQGTSANVVNSEGEIIRSMDLCRQVAESIGPSRILPKSVSGNSNLTAAAMTLFGGLTVDVPKYSNIIKIGMTHPDPEIAQRALEQIIEFYFKRHVEIHRGLGTMDAVLAQQTDQIRSRLIQTDQEIQDLRNKVGVLSLDDSRKAITEQMGNIRQMILTAEAELAEYQLLARTNLAPAVIPPAATNVPSTIRPAKVATDSSVVPAKPNPVATPVPAPVPERSAEYRKGLVTRIESLRRQEQDLRELRTAAGVAATDGKNNYNDQIGRVRQMILTAETELAEYSAPAKGAAQPVATAGPSAPQPVAAPVKTPAVASAGSNVLEAEVSTPTPERFIEYKALIGRLEALRRQEIDLRNIYKDQNPTLIRVREQLAESEVNRKAIEKENPTFASYFSPENARSATASSSTGSIPVMPLPNGGMDPNRVRALEARLKVLNAQMEKQKQEATALEQFETQFNQLQRKRELDEKNYRHFAAGLEQSRFDEALGSGKLANISVVQSPSPAAPSEGKRMKISAMALAAGVGGGIALALLIELMLDHTVRRSTQLETALALPLLSTIPWIRVGARRPRLQIGNGDLGALEKNGGAGPDIPGWSPGHPLRPHIEALRDRTLMHFEGDLRKPKLIGVTACRDGAGATTIACALAAALSESADGRVLLINLDAGSQSLHPLLLGQQARSVVDVVEAGDRETAMIGNNLYVASGYGDGSGNTVLHPTSIARMLPKIKMSDYDYVVFDMPIVSPTSITSKLAGMVDLVFMVAESEKDSQNKLKRACQLLAESNATFRIVLNKFERYVPKWLDHEA